MEKVLPCRKCGSTPYFKPYEQSNDGNHDIPAYVTCLMCGRKTVMDWDLWRKVEEEVGDEKHATQTSYLSARFIDALGDATIRKWNRENVGRPVTEHVCRIEESRADAMGSIPCERREEIVRCRDCKYAIEHRSKSILGIEIVTLTCSGPIQGTYSEGADVEPEDFCSWASRRERDA